MNLRTKLRTVGLIGAAVLGLGLVTAAAAPGASARSLLHWGAVPADDENGAACEPTATGVVVTPPDQTTALLRPWSFGPVCQHGLIQQNAYVAGSAAF